MVENYNLPKSEVNSFHLIRVSKILRKKKSKTSRFLEIHRIFVTRELRLKNEKKNRAVNRHKVERKLLMIRGTISLSVTAIDVPQSRYVSTLTSRRAVTAAPRADPLCVPCQLLCFVKVKRALK